MRIYMHFLYSALIKNQISYGLINVPLAGRVDSLSVCKTSSSRCTSLIPRASLIVRNHGEKTFYGRKSCEGRPVYRYAYKQRCLYT